MGRLDYGRKKDSPYKLTRIITEEAGTSHAVYATLSYTQGKVESSHSFALNSYEIPSSNSVMHTFRLKTGYSDYKNGDLLEGIARQFIGTDVKSTYELVLYLDNYQIGSSKIFPYEVSYKLENLNQGEHTMKQEWIRYDENGKKTNSFSTDQSITITK